jgi:carbamate kinase
MLTDVEAVFRDWGGPDQAAIGSITPDALDAMTFATGSMGPKITAACDFVRAGGTMAGIGRLQDARRIVEGVAGTQVRMEPLAPENRPPGEKNSGRVSKHQPEAVQSPA